MQEEQITKIRYCASDPSLWSKMYINKYAKWQLTLINFNPSGGAKETYLLTEKTFLI